MAATYLIEDEPRPGALGSWVVSPIWPLFSIMFAGNWLAMPWFAFNAYAVGSPTRGREAVIAAAGLFGKAALAIGLVALVAGEVVPKPALKYLAVALAVWKLGFAYWLYSLQSRTFHLFEYYGGTVRKGFVPVIAGAVLSPLLFKSVFLALLLE